MAFHFYVMNNILYLIEFVLSDRISPSLPPCPRLLLMLLLLPSSHHHIFCLAPTTRRRHFAVAHSILSTQEVNTPIQYMSHRSFLIVSFSHRVFGRSLVSFLALVCSINRHHPFIFTPS